MRRKPYLGALALAAAAGGAVAQAGPQSGPVRTFSRELPRGLAAEDALLADIGGEGTVDVVVNGRVKGKAYARVLLIFTPLKEGVLSEPVRLDLTPDVVAWATADVHPDAGAELVLFTATSAFALRPSAAEGERYVRLASCDFLWQLPDQKELLPCPRAVRDVDGDRLDDLVIPEPGGYRIALQRRSQGSVRFDTERVLRVPPEDADWDGLGPELAGRAAVRGGSRGSSISFAVSLSGESESAGESRTLLAVVEAVPAPQLSDWDGDGRLDLLAQTSERLHVWTQGPSAAFAEAPSASFVLPVEADRGRRLDASYSAHVLDLDGDRRTDCAIFAGDSRAKDVRTQMLAFLSGAQGARARAGDPANLFGERGVPQDVLVLAGFVAASDFTDLDADGLPEMVARTVRPDLIDQLRSAASETIDADLHVYRNLGGRLARRPALSWRTTFALKSFMPVVSFVGDVTGDGLSELVVRDQPDRVRLLRLRAQRDGWTLVERPLWEFSLDPKADLRELRAPGRAVRELVLLEPARVVFARFGR